MTFFLKASIRPQTRKSQGVTHVSQICHLGTMNDCIKCNGKPSAIYFIIFLVFSVCTKVANLEYSTELCVYLKTMSVLNLM